MQLSEYDLKLESLHSNSVGRLSLADTFSPAAFDELYQYLCKKAELLKPEYVVSKQIIAVIISAQRAIENSAAYNTEGRNHQAMANQFATLLDLIARSEAPSDRVPGVPRVV